MAWPAVTVWDWDRFRKIVDDMLPEGRPDQPGYVFRGQSDVTWGLRPSLARLLEGWSVAQAIGAERAALQEFQAHAVLHLPPNILSRTTDPMGWWTIMQHYGAPTRLLDWTTSPYVAAYFAVAGGWGPRGSDGVVWYFFGHALEEKMKAAGWELRKGSFESTDEVIKYFYDTFWNPDMPSRISTVRRTDLEERMVAQQGIFTVGPNLLDDQAHVVEQALADEGQERFGRIIIPKILKKNILMKLRFMNISSNSLFPGIDGMGRSIDEFIRLFPSPPPPSPPFGTFTATASNCFPSPRRR